MKFFLFLVTLLMNFHLEAFAEESFFKESARGWHWYERNGVQKEEKKANDATSGAGANTVMKELQAKVEEKLNQAILYPTEKNIISYILLQDKVLNKGETFANNWQKVLFKYPELDKMVFNPTNQNALHIYHAEEQKKKEAKIKALAKEYGLIYFYRGSCPYCKAFAPVIKEFADKYNWSILPVSLDGEISAEFPNSKKDNGIAKALNVTVVPAVIALHPKSKDQIPLAYGFISQQEMLNRINLLLEDKQ